MQTTQRLTLEQLGGTAGDVAALKWARAAPGVHSVYFQPDSRELVLTYDIAECTLGEICRHLSQGGVAYDTSLLERFRQLNVERAERRARKPVAPKSTQAFLAHSRLGTPA